MRRTTPAPRCGELVRRLGELIREHHCDLADLITTEVGKIRSEALGEVQEMIDICEFAVSLASARLLARADEDVGGPVDVHRLLLAARATGSRSLMTRGWPWSVRPGPPGWAGRSRVVSP
ncbi:MAG: aldehyde dehydrogenase family protein [Pseudonocardiaceae bacterium]